MIIQNSWLKPRPALPQCRVVCAVIETDVFMCAAAAGWIEGKRIVLINWLAASPDAGDVNPGSGGRRKVRWVRPGMGKPGGACVNARMRGIFQQPDTATRAVFNYSFYVCNFNINGEAN